MKRLQTTVRRHLFDVFVVLMALESALEVPLRDAEDGPTSPLWFAVPASALIVLPLLARRRYPFAAPATVWILAAAVSFADGRLVPFLAAGNLAGMVAAYLLGNLHDTRQGRIGLLVVVASATLVMVNNPTASTGELIAVPLLFALGWVAGFALRERAEQAQAAERRAAQAERERDAATRIAVAEERARIARELHDVVAHAVSVMVLQVGAVRHKLPPELEEDREALGRVEEAGRTALAEMRRLLGAMRREGDGVALAPQPGLDGLERLVEEVSRAGLPVTLHVEGARAPLPRALDLSAYRIVQEGLTNALKHANAGHADVTVRYEPSDVRVEVRDDGAGGAADDGLGHGLVGIRERVKIFGGEMTVGTTPEGGFVLSARLPLREDGA